jgi:hypothetical protein
VQNGRGKVDIVFKLTTDGVTRYDCDKGYLLGDDLVAQRDEGIACFMQAKSAESCSEKYIGLQP